MKKILPILAVLSVIALSLILFFVYKSNKSATISITQPKYIDEDAELETNFALETPNIKDKNLAQFYLWTKEDPLFTGPNFNMESFLKAVKILENEEKLYFKNDDLSSGLYPIQFLKDLEEVNAAHELFMEDPSSSNAAELIKSYKKTVLDYDSNLNLLTEKINALKSPSNEKADIVQINIKFTTDTIKNDLKKLSQNAKELDSEISKREECLNNGKNCIRPAKNFSNFQLQNSKYTFTKKDVLPKDVLMSTSLNGEWTGPYIVETACLGWTNDLKPMPRLYYVTKDTEYRDYEKDQEDLKVFIPKLATTNYYRSIAVVPLSEKLYKNVNKANMIYSLETNTYMCPDANYAMQLASIDKYYLDYSNKRIFKELLALRGAPDKIKPFFEEGDRLEKVFFDAEFPSEKDANNLANYYGYLYKKAIVWMNDPKYQNQDWAKSLFVNRDEYLNRYLEYKLKLTNFDGVLARAAGNFSSARVRYDILSQRDDFFIYIARNMYGLVYFPFSSSFYRLSTPPTYIDKVIVKANRGFITYQDAIKKYSIEEIKTWAFDHGSILKEEYEKNK